MANFRALCVLFAAYCLAYLPVAALAAGEWAGSFSGDNLAVTLQAGGGDGNEYAGTITLGGRVMPARGRFDPANGFTGVFESDGSQFTFSLAEMPGGVIVLSSGQKQYALKRQTIPNTGGKLPAFLRPGLRISLSGGNSIVAAESSKLVPAPNGNGQWVNPQTGKSYNLEDTNNSGGVGIVQIDILHADDNIIVAEVRNYLMADLQSRLVTLNSVVGITGTAESLGVYWINPAILARWQEGVDAQGKVSRLRYSVGQQTFDAIAIEQNSAVSYSNRIYDLATGLLLSDSNSTVGDDVTTINPVTGQTGQGRGSAAIAHARFINARQVDLPWAAEPPPPWAATTGQTLELSGGYAAVLPTGSLPALPITMSFEVVQPTGPAIAAAVVKMHTWRGIGDNLPVQESVTQRCFSSAGRGCLWLSPRVAQQLQAGTVIDEDPVVQYRTTFAGMQGGIAVVVEQGPLDVTQYGYDMRTGMLNWLKVSRVNQTGRVETELQAR